MAEFPVSSCSVDTCPNRGLLKVHGVLLCHLHARALQLIEPEASRGGLLAYGRRLLKRFN
jgi:hypothetical protein